MNPAWGVALEQSYNMFYFFHHCFWSRNQLSVLPACVCGLPLRVLNASNNKLNALPESIGQLTNLMELVSVCAYMCMCVHVWKLYICMCPYMKCLWCILCVLLINDHIGSLILNFTLLIFTPLHVCSY